MDMPWKIRLKSLMLSYAVYAIQTLFRNAIFHCGSQEIRSIECFSEKFFIVPLHIL